MKEILSDYGSAILYFLLGSMIIGGFSMALYLFSI